MADKKTMTETVFKYLKMNMDLSDDDFNLIYPAPIQNLAKKHWTPINVARKAVDFLVPFPGTKVLDIGSGAGKFCLIGASSTQGHFTGIEQRNNLVDLSVEIAFANGIENVQFIPANITEVDFTAYDSFYFYNSFHENIDDEARIDDQIEMSQKYYEFYSDYVNLELSKKPIGTRLVTYWSSLKEVPSNYQIQYMAFDGLLKFWKKVV